MINIVLVNIRNTYVNYSHCGYIHIKTKSILAILLPNIKLTQAHYS